MANKYLDLTGLSYFWNKIKTWIQNYAKITTVNSTSSITIGNTTLTPVLKDGDKVLSDNNFTDALKDKLDGIETGAEVNVNADWDAVSGDAEILNKPNIPIDTSDLTNGAGFITLSDVPPGASASSTIPLMDGTATIGSDPGFARGDHIHPSDTKKVDKVENATNGNFASLDSTGNLIDSGKKASDFLLPIDIEGKEDNSNKVTSLSSLSTNEEYPSAKCVYDLIGNIETLLASI